MGVDGWLYVSIGDKGIPKMTRKEANEGSVYVTEGRERRTKEGHYISLEGGGVIRFRPDGIAFGGVLPAARATTSTCRSTTTTASSCATTPTTAAAGGRG